MAKRKHRRPDPVGQAPAALDENPTDFEQQRQERIKRNALHMAELGLAVPQKQPRELPPARHSRSKHRVKATPTAPARCSDRLRGQPAALDQASELALFKINQECPRCGKVLQTCHQAHLDFCRIARQAHKPDVDAEADADVGLENEDPEVDVPPKKPEAPRISAAKLKDLQLLGLVDQSEEAARVLVQGSQQSNYRVTLANKGHSCECMSFRMRRGVCKHIKLVLDYLEIGHDPESWQQALTSKASELSTC